MRPFFASVYFVSSSTVEVEELKAVFLGPQNQSSNHPREDISSGRSQPHDPMGIFIVNLRHVNELVLQEGCLPKSSIVLSWLSWLSSVTGTGAVVFAQLTFKDPI